MLAVRGRAVRAKVARDQADQGYVGSRSGYGHQIQAQTFFLLLCNKRPSSCVVFLRVELSSKIFRNCRITGCANNMTAMYLEIPKGARPVARVLLLGPRGRLLLLL